MYCLFNEGVYLTRTVRNHYCFVLMFRYTSDCSLQTKVNMTLLQNERIKFLFHG